jgi:Heparinase II/III-like protein
MVTAERLVARREEIAASTDLAALARRVAQRNARVIEGLPPVPEVKALLSVDGGICPEDGTALRFDPWSPTEHACPGCGRRFRGERHDRAWAKFQHLWLAERAVELAALGALTDADPAAERATQILGAYADRYFRYPNADNVLGPSRLFFSTYLESIWVLNYLAAAALLREAGRLDERTARAVHTVADEAANIIGEYDEGFSNRQTWNNAALCAIAVWFEDEDLARRAIQGETGLVAHLRGYRDDGLWYEGENYHLFALRGLLTGIGWAAEAGMDFFAEPDLTRPVVRALRAPALTALPDFTFPARKDARFGVSLAQPMYLELWEVGLGRLGSGEEGAAEVEQELVSWLQALYGSGPARLELFESYLHDAPIPPLPAPRSRRDLSWWALLEMKPDLPPAEPWVPHSALLPGQGLAVLRSGERYVSLECGSTGGGHGHADRLNLTLHADGVYWLPDFGTGSYVSRDLFWYRSTLAHNAPRLDGRSQSSGDASLVGFDEQEAWRWTRGRFESLSRSVIVGERYVLDVLELAGSEDRTVELPWHFTGALTLPDGPWHPAELPDGAYVTDVRSLAVTDDAGVTAEVRSGERRLTARFAFPGELLRAKAPGAPGSEAPHEFLVLRGAGRNLRFVTLVDFGAGEDAVRALRARGDVVEVETARGQDVHRFTGREWLIDTPGGRVVLKTASGAEPASVGLLDLEPPRPPSGAALRVDQAPALDGSFAGFDFSEPLLLELEDQYRRSEEAYSGPDDFSARCAVNWDDAGLYLAVEVVTATPSFRTGSAAPLRLDNEPDDIHSDGLQIYLGERDTGAPGGAWMGILVVPEPGSSDVRVRAVSDSPPPVAVRGAWRRTETGYRVTLALAWPEWLLTHVGGRLGFDLLVNEMRPGRQRRAGQLVWTGGNGWIWLRGDRQDPARFGILDLVG